MRFLNSLQFRLYAIFFAISVLLAVLIYIDLDAIETLAGRQRALNYASQQRSNSYLLSTLSFRLSATEDEAEQASLTEAIEQVMTNFEEIQLALREGDEELGIEPIENPQMLLILAEVDQRWLRYQDALERFLALPPDERDNSPALNDIDTQSTALYSYTDRVVAAFDAIVEEDQRNIQRISTAVGVLAVLLFLLIIYVVSRIVRSINNLRNAAAELSTGNLAARAETGTLNEISQVAQGFNHMAEQIGTLITTLEQRVKEAEAARQQAERADQVKSAFLASMSHELRTPLNSVINFTKFVANEVMGPVNPDQKETLDEVIDSASHLLSLINDVLDMSKIESGTLTLFVEDNVNLDKLLDTVVSTTRSLITEKPVTLEVVRPESMPLMRGDRQRILQIMLNIVSNACKFTEAGSIKIAAATNNGTFQLSVKDTGPGIAPEDKNLVFEPFKQTETGLRQGGGTGLGMPITKNLVESHNGRIWLESVPGQGATFHIELPVRSEKLVPIFSAKDRVI